MERRATRGRARPTDSTQDTTACTLSFALAFLAAHPDVQARLREEIRANIPVSDPAKGVRVLKYDDLQTKSLPVLRGVLMEALRLAPPVPVDTKMAAVDSVLPGGFRVLKGTRVAYEPYVMGRDETVWGPDAARFRPERWAARALPSAYDFPVFQAGPRVCLGEAMAKYEAQLVIAAVVDRFEFRLPRAWAHWAGEYHFGITISVRGADVLEVSRAA